MSNTQARCRTALITGGASRIGAAISRSLYEHGWNIIVHSQNLEKAEQFIAGLPPRVDSNQFALPIMFDLFSIESIESALATEVFKNKPLDALIHNASAFFATTPEAVTVDQWNTLIDSNAFGPLFLTRALLQSLQLNAGNIVSLLDIHALGQPYRNHVAYNMAKAAHLAMVLSLAKDLAPHIRVNAVAPGAILWPEELHPGAISNEEQQQIVHSIPLQRLGQPEDIAQAVRFLLDAPYITGQVIKVDGGRALTIGGENYF